MLQKHLPILAAALICACACSIKEDRISCSAPVTVHVDHFSISQEDLPPTKATPISDYAGVKAITLAFFRSDGTESFNSTQLLSDDSTYSTFGDFSCTLPYGSYKMVVIGYGADSPITLTSASEASYGADETVRETFVATQDVEISSSTPLSLSATLDRIIAKLRIVSTDGRPAGVKFIRTTFAAGGKGFNPLTGLATSNTGFTNKVETHVDVGAVTKPVSYLFLASDEQSIDLTIETLDENDNVLNTISVPAVPFQRNRVTVLTGSLYSASASTAFQVNEAYIEEDISVSF